jgi:MFS transporter, Spinster family, sphingosine-1-phosphate transporter
MQVVPPESKQPPGALAAHDGWSWRRPAVVMPLVALTLINLFNYIDRYVLSAVATKLELPPDQGGLSLDKGQQGDLYSAFIIVYALASPSFGVLGDRFRRTWLVAAAVLLWSVATSASGFMWSFGALLVARALTGVGEAAYASVTPSIISDLVPSRARGRALAVFNAAIPVGAALGFVVGGAMAEAYGWREAFLVAGLPGVALALWVAFMREPVRGAMDEGERASPQPLVTVMRHLARRTFTLPVMGYVLQTAGFGALGFWAPSYLEQAKGMSTGTATMVFGAVIVATGLSGTILGGVLGDRWLRRDPRGLMWTCAISSLLAVPFVAGVVLCQAPWAVWCCIAAGSFLLVMSVGPVNAQIVNTLRPTERATGVAVCTMLIHLLGDVPSVPAIGAVNDALAPQLGVAGAWERAYLIVPALVLGGALVWFAAALWGCRDEHTHRAEAA